MKWELNNTNNLYLHENEVHVWYIDIKEQLTSIDLYWNVLSADEKNKALAYKFEKDKNCAIIARGTLRELLGQYLKTKPSALNFKYSKYGKPRVINSDEIQFNLSHSGTTILIGFVKNHHIGIDVERIKEIDYMAVGQHSFSKEELNNLLALDKAYHTQAFYNCWTRKEAFIKAVGSGLSFPLDQFVVSLDSAEKAYLLDTKWNTNEKLQWTLHSIIPDENYIGAFAIKGKVNLTFHYKYTQKKAHDIIRNTN